MSFCVGENNRLFGERDVVGWAVHPETGLDRRTIEDRNCCVVEIMEDRDDFAIYFLGRRHARGASNSKISKEHEGRHRKAGEAGSYRRSEAEESSAAMVL